MPQLNFDQVAIGVCLELVTRGISSVVRIPCLYPYTDSFCPTSPLEQRRSSGGNGSETS